MTNYAGNSFLLKIGTWSGGTAIADCRTHSLSRNNEQVDVTNKSSSNWRTLLAAAGTKSWDITFDGVMTNDSGFETLQGYMDANSINAFAMQWADGDTIEGNFAVSSFEVAAGTNAEQTFSCTLMSSGAVTLTGA